MLLIQPLHPERMLRFAQMRRGFFRPGEKVTTVTIPRTEDYAVLRYDQEAPLNYRRHDLTLNRYPSRVAGILAIEDMRETADPDKLSCLDYLHVEERTEYWEDEFELIDLSEVLPHFELNGTILTFPTCFWPKED